MPLDYYSTPGSAPCRAVELTASAIGLELNEKSLDLSKQEHLTPEFIAINPQHTVPTIVDKGFALWESAAIVTYLVQQYGKDSSLYPKDIKIRALVDQRLFFNVGTLATRFGDYYYPTLFANAAPDPAKFEKMVEAVKYLDKFLEGEEFVAGKCLTVADISIVSTIATFDVVKFDLSPYKNIVKWYKKVQTSIPNYEKINGKAMLSKIFEKFMKK